MIRQLSACVKNKGPTGKKSEKKKEKKKRKVKRREKWRGRKRTMAANFCAEVTVTLAMTLRGRNQACRKGSEECVPVHLCDDIASDSQIP